MARSKKSLEQHWLQGSTPQWSADAPPSFAAGKPKMPGDLSPVERAEWKRLVKELEQRGTLTRCDSSALEIYVRCFGRYKRACEEVEKHGPVIESTWTDQHGTEHSKLVENPASKIAGRLESTLRHMLREFSATPASRERAKPAAPPEPKKDECPWPEGSMGWLEWMKAKGRAVPAEESPAAQPAITEQDTDFEV